MLFGFPRPLTGDPASEMEAFIDLKPTKVAPATVNAVPVAPEGHEVGRIVGRKGANFLVRVGNDVREVPPTDIKQILR